MTELNYFQKAALNRLGDVICPKNGEFPSFSELDCVHHAHLVLDDLPPQDLSDLKMLLFALWFLPAPLMRLFLFTLEKMNDMDGEVGTLVRMLQFGLRGIAFALYYSDLTGPKATAKRTPVSVVGYAVNVATN
ncbi:MAG: hypothetical protein ACJ76H_08905 [Bacteriovoracaceae bacterium]